VDGQDEDGGLGVSRAVAAQSVEAPAQDDARLRRRFLRAVSLTFGYSLLIQVLGKFPGSSPRALGPDGQGALSAIAARPGLLTALIGFTTASSVTYHTARHPGRERQVFATAF
jgi:hypothetical protein